MKEQNKNIITKINNFSRDLCIYVLTYCEDHKKDLENGFQFFSFKSTLISIGVTFKHLNPEKQSVLKYIMIF